MNTGIEAVADGFFRQALAHHRAERIEEARAAYEKVLQFQPRHVAALTFLSMIALQSKDPKRALRLAAEALQSDPSNAAAHLMQGNAHFDLQRPTAALASYERAIAPKPDLAEAHFRRGNVLSDLGRHQEAVVSYDRALALTPQAAEVHNNRGNSLRILKRYAEAVDGYGRAIAAAPCIAEPHFNQGLALYELDRPTEALASFDRAIALRPEYAEAHLSRGNALKRLSQPQAALASYQRAVQLKGDYAEALCNQGNVQSELGRFDAALASYDAAIAAAPGYADAHCNRGNLLGDMMRFEEALQSFDLAIAADPGYAQARYCKSLVSLLLGDWESGWRDFEWRWENPHCASIKERRNFPQPQWLGAEPLEGRSILLYGEQGLGDVIQFCRYATLVAERGARVILQAPRALGNLLRSLPGVAQVVAPGEPLPHFDFHCPLLSLPLAFHSTPATIPARVPYLRSSIGKSQQWRDKLGAAAKPRVGVVWSGGFRADQPELWAVNNRRNIPLAEMAGLIHPGMEFYSLQKGEPAESELAQCKAGAGAAPELIDVARELHDFEDTAALIEQLDLVISVDTSTAHLAGALGKPVWILNRFDTCWRWFLQRTDSPWYPTARIYRQERPHDWSGVVGRVRADLARFAATGVI
jgi:hypothetical protein